MNDLIHLFRVLKYKLLLFLQQAGKTLTGWINGLTMFLAGLAVGDIFVQIGMPIGTEWAMFFRTANFILIVYFGVVAIYRILWSLLTTRSVTPWLVAHVCIIWVYVIYADTFGEWTRHRYVVDAVLFVLSLYELSSLSLGVLMRKASPTTLFAGSFLLFIGIGTVLLLGPKCHYYDLTLQQALFTSVSSVCVNGMAIVDLPRTFTTYGQGVIIGLIQVGGLGVMTFTCFFALSMTGKGSLHNRMVIKDLISADNVSDIFQTLKHIIYVTVIIEGLAAWILYYYFRDALPGAPTRDVVFYAIFHSISAFCNAGVSNFPGGLTNPVVAHSHLLHMTIAFTLIIGGAGFPLQSAAINMVGERIEGLFRRLFRMPKSDRHFHLSHLNVSNKLVFFTNIILLAVGLVYFLLSEAGATQAGKSFFDRVLDSFFLSASIRTTGFFYNNIMEFTPATLMMMMLLMWIGCAPMSTGGGIKLTTFAVAMLNLKNILRGRDEHIEIFGRRISPVSVRKAFATILVSILMIFVSTVALKLLMPDISSGKLLFESCAAVSAAGISLDVTPLLSVPAQWVLMADMFIGRIGVLAFLLIFVTPAPTPRYSYPTEVIMM